MVQLRFDVANSDSIPDEVKHRLVSLSGNQITEEGILIIESQRFRTQKRNRGDAVERLTRLVRRAAEKPKCRRRTKPTIASKEQRLEIKRRRAQAKRERAAVSMEKE
jgi:ribosome-associated protein